MYTNFSTQDMQALVPQRYDVPEFLSATDAGIAAGRRLTVTARGMDGLRSEGVLPSTTPAEETSRELQAEAGMSPDETVFTG